MDEDDEDEELSSDAVVEDDGAEHPLTLDEVDAEYAMLDVEEDDRRAAEMWEDDDQECVNEPCVSLCAFSVKRLCISSHELLSPDGVIEDDSDGHVLALDEAGAEYAMFQRDAEMWADGDRGLMNELFTVLFLCTFSERESRVAMVVGCNLMSPSS